MNFRTPTLIALTAAFSLTAISAQAAMPAPKGKMDRAAMHAKIDANEDGKISVQEMTDHRTRTVSAALKKADTNGDGFLTKEEINKMRSLRTERHEYHKEMRAEKREERKEKNGEKRPDKWEKAPEAN